MYVCICHSVKDSQIATAIHQGQDTLAKLQASLVVGTCCGCCVPMVQDMLDASAKVNELAKDALAG